MIAKDMLSSGHAGWYFAGKMPWADRLSWGLLVLLEAGVTEQVRELHLQMLEGGVGIFLSLLDPQPKRLDRVPP